MKFIEKVKNLSNDGKLFFFTILSALLFWLLSEVFDSIFKNIILAFLFILTPYIATFITEYLKKINFFKNFTFSILKYISLFIVSFLVFFIFYFPIFHNVQNAPDPFSFGLYGVVITFVMIGAVDLGTNILHFINSGIKNVLITGAISYFLAIAIFTPVFATYKVFFNNASGLQLFFKLIFQSLTLGPIYALNYLFIKDVDKFDEFINFVERGFKENNIKEEEEEKDSTSEKND